MLDVQGYLLILIPLGYCKIGQLVHKDQAEVA